MSNVYAKVKHQPLLYRDQNGNFYIRKKFLQGDREIDTQIPLHTKVFSEATEARDAYRKAQGAAAVGIAYNPDTAVWTVNQVLDFYEKAGFPNRQQIKKQGSNLKTEQGAITPLKEFFGNKPVTELRPMLLDAYLEWRKKKIASDKKVLKAKRAKARKDKEQNEKEKTDQG